MSGLASSQRVWFVVYHPSEERRIRARIKEFQACTLEAKHKWHLVDITKEPSKWLSNHEYSLDYFSHPDAITAIAGELRDHITSVILGVLHAPSVDDNTVVSVVGTGCLFGFGSVSNIISNVENAIKGRLLFFFPGEYDRNQYRFMDARDGFNYMAVPITGSSRMQV